MAATGSVIHDLGWGRIPQGSSIFEANLGTSCDVTRAQGIVYKQTTDDTPISSGEFLPFGLVGRAIGTVAVRVIALKNDNSVAGTWHIGRSAKWDAGLAIAAVGAQFDISPEQGSSGYTVTLDFATGVEVLMTGAVGDTVDWLVEFEFICMENLP